MTGKERISHILKHEPVDRIGLYEHFWSDTHRSWAEQGKIKPEDEMADVFGFDMDEFWAFNLVADLDFVPQIVAEDEETITMLNGNGATLRSHKQHDTTPEHVAFAIETREDWEGKIKPLLTPDWRRINVEGYRRMRDKCRAENRFFVWSGVAAFECIHPVTGHVNMLMGMVDDPEWIEDMAMTYAKLTVEMQKMLFEKEGWPDGIWYYEDMGYKGSPFMSPDFYRQMIKPAHEYVIKFAHDNNLPVIMHSCGYVEPLLPDMIDAGIDCLQVIEIKAGMDLIKLYEKFGDKIAFMGGIDVRKLYTNDKAQIDEELETKIPVVKRKNGFVLHSDHSIPKTVDFETYKYFIQRGLELGTY